MSGVIAGAARVTLPPMPQFVTITAREIGSTLGQEPPEWIELMPIGRMRFADSRRSELLADVDQVIARSFAADDKLPIDVDHSTERGETTAAVGWIVAMRAEGERLMARVEWNDEGRRLISGQVFRRISPSWLSEKGKNRVHRIVRAALTNNPALPQLTPLAASMEDEMDLTELAELLGLEADADLTEIMTAARKLKEGSDAQAAAMSAIAEAVGAEANTAAADLATTVASRVETGAKPDPAKFVPKKAFDELTAEVASLRQDRASEKAEAAVAEAKAAGKITPAMEDWALDYASSDPKGFAAFVEKSAAVVEPGAQIQGKPKAKTAELDPARALIAANCGVSPEAFQKTEQKLAAEAAARQEA